MKRVNLLNRIKYSAFPLILLLVIVSSGCVYNNSLFNRTRVYYSPEEIKTDSKERDVNFTVRPDYWHGSPENIRRYVFPVYLSVQNSSVNPIIIEREDIVLLDGSRNQYNALDPDDVANILISTETSGYRVYPSVSVGIGGYYHHGYYYGHHRFPYWDPWYYDDYPFYDYPLTYYRPDYKDIYTEAFQPGKIMPNAKLSGFVYFKKLPSVNDKIVIQVNYRSQDSDEVHSLDFPFSVVVEN